MNENAKKWTAALRSGQFKQGEGALAHVFSWKAEEGDGPDLTNVHYCCLGVACHVFLMEGNELGVRFSQVSNTVFFGGHETRLPTAVRLWLGLKDNSGTMEDHDHYSLADMNDEGYTFSDIADVIESQPKGLFES